jgi:hypothetical protein
MIMGRNSQELIPLEMQVLNRRAMDGKPWQLPRRIKNIFLCSIYCPPLCKGTV